jgi:hypothetical protein
MSWPIRRDRPVVEHSGRCRRRSCLTAHDQVRGRSGFEPARTPGGADARLEARRGFAIGSNGEDGRVAGSKAQHCAAFPVAIGFPVIVTGRGRRRAGNAAGARLHHRHVGAGEACADRLEQERPGEQGGKNAPVQPVSNDAPDSSHRKPMPETRNIVTASRYDEASGQSLTCIKRGAKAFRRSRAPGRCGGGARPAARSRPPLHRSGEVERGRGIAVSSVGVRQGSLVPHAFNSRLISLTNRQSVCSATISLGSSRSFPTRGSRSRSRPTDRQPDFGCRDTIR